MSTQQVLTVTRVALFELVDNKTVERGNCACAIVASPGAPPRYSLVCYNDQRVTLCTASIKSSNDHSLQFQLQVNDYASFRDDKANKWNMMFLKSAQLEKFCAVLGCALFGASGAPMHTAVIADFSPPNIDSRVTLQHRVKARYTAFAIRTQASNGLHVVEDAIETNGDRPYNFQPTQSAMAREDGKGFESCCLGMAEEGTRAIVVPASMPRAGRSPYPGVDVVVFVVQVIRVLADALHVDDATTVPTVFGAGGGGSNAGNDGNSGALVAVTPASSSALVAVGNVANELPSPPASGVPGAVGSGVPAEHMMMIQKAAGMINTSTTATRDLHDKIYAFAQDWKQSVNRPKPTALTNQGLEQSVKQLIAENEKMREDVLQRDELIKSLDNRNRDLQKRVDTAAMVAQQLMDEKNKTVSSSSDMKLEKDRIVMKLQEQVTGASNERDDVHRHLQTVKKLLDVSDNELRDLKGKIDVHTVQAQSLAGKLDASEDALAEERSRRKALEAKVLALQDEIREAEADLHTKTASVEEINRKADSERAYQAQLMEDERQRRSFEAQQLRSEIVNELHQREEKFKADRARVAEDHFKRGHDEGKAIGRNHARIDVEARLEELMLDAQRAKTELDAYKTELRTTTEEAMAENRRLEAIVLQLKKTTDEGTRRKAQNEFQLQGLRLRVRNAEDALLLGMTSIAHRLTRPAAPQDLVATLSALRDGENPRLQFQIDAHKEERAAAYEMRYRWLLEDAEAAYLELLTDAHTAHVQATDALGQTLRGTIAQLWLARDEADCLSMMSLESDERVAVVSESDAFFEGLEAWRDAQVAEQVQILDDEVSARSALADDADASVGSFVEALRAFVDAQAAERAALEGVEQDARVASEQEMDETLHRHAGGFMAYLEAQRHEREQVYTDEADGRATMEADGEAWFEQLEALRSAEAADRANLEAACDEGVAEGCHAEEAAEWKELIRQHELKLFADLIAAQDDLSEEETSARDAVHEEEGSTWTELSTSEVQEGAAIRTREEELARIAAALEACLQEEADERLAITRTEEDAFEPLADSFAREGDALKSVGAVAPTGASALNRNSMQVPSASSSSPAPTASSEPLDPLLGHSGGTRASLVVESSKPSKSPFGGDTDSDSDAGPKMTKKPPAAAAPKKAPAGAAAASSPTANLFGSDSDSDAVPQPVKKAPPKKAARKVVPKRNQLFDSDED